MPRKRVHMRKIREVLRLKLGLKLSDRDTAQSCKLSRSTVGEYVHRARAASITWPLPPEIDDHTLDKLLFKQAYNKSTAPDRSETQTENPIAASTPDWNLVHAELQRKGVTRLLLWREYKTQQADGMGYTKFTRDYKTWKAQRGLTMRQIHKAGEKLFVDYAGLTVPITDASTGEIHQAQVFVATLGASNYTYCEITNSQNLEDWIGSHRRALEFFGGCPRVIVPDNLKSGVNNPCTYEPELNRSYAEFAQHYGIAVIPARVRKPKDKAKVEVHVQIVERDILAPLRNRVFFDLIEANQAVHELLEALNNKPFQKLEGSRTSVFEQLEKPELQPLPLEPYVLAFWRKAKVNIDYHIEIDMHYYSVPYQLARAAVEVRLTQFTLEVFMQGKRVAVHARVLNVPKNRGRHTTITEHMPKAHQRHGDWSPQRLLNWASKNGVFTEKVVAQILETRAHPEQGYRSCLGLMRLGKTFGAERLEAACKRADTLRAYSFKSVQSILQKRLDFEPVPLEDNRRDVQFVHGNLRGAAYYKSDSTILEVISSTEKRNGSC